MAGNGFSLESRTGKNGIELCTYEVEVLGVGWMCIRLCGINFAKGEVCNYSYKEENCPANAYKPHLKAVEPAPTTWPGKP